MNNAIAEILQAHRQGDPAALGELVRHCLARIEFIARKLLQGHPEVHRWEETADVVQKSAVRLVAALQALEPESECHLLRLAALQVRRELIDLVRHYNGPHSPVAKLATNSFKDGSDIALHVENISDKHADTATANERWERFHAAVAGLPDEERQVFEMTWYLGVDQETIAGVKGCSTRTVKRRWQNAQSMIKVAMAGDSPC